MTYILKSSDMLQSLQDSIDKEAAAREERRMKCNSVPAPIEKEPYKKDIRKQPTAEDLLLMEEYSHGVYQGD